VREAAELIEFCEHCNSDAEIPFDWILDRETCNLGSETDYILETPAKCPNCKRENWGKDARGADRVTMPRTRIHSEKIRAELAWVNETPDPHKCGCRNVRRCEETGHAPGTCSRLRHLAQRSA
jgi:hypothetical protein